MELCHHCLEVGTREFPFEWCSDVLIVLLEAKESGFDFCKRTEVVGSERLAFNARRVFWIMDNGSSASRHSPVFGASKQPSPTSSRCINRSTQAGSIKSKFTSPSVDCSQRPKNFDAMNIHRGQVRPGATPRVLVLDTSGLTWGRGGKGRHACECAPGCWSSRLSRAQTRRLAEGGLPSASRKGPGYARLWKINCGSRRENPGAMLPRANRISGSPRQTVLVA